jgi:hypothetical protein
MVQAAMAHSRRFFGGLGRKLGQASGAEGAEDNGRDGNHSDCLDTTAMNEDPLHGTTEVHTLLAGTAWQRRVAPEACGTADKDFRSGGLAAPQGATHAASSGKHESEQVLGPGRFLSLKVRVPFGRLWGGEKETPATAAAHGNGSPCSLEAQNSAGGAQTRAHGQEGCLQDVHGDPNMGEALAQKNEARCTWAETDLPQEDRASAGAVWDRAQSHLKLLSIAEIAQQAKSKLRLGALVGVRAQQADKECLDGSTDGASCCAMSGQTCAQPDDMQAVSMHQGRVQESCRDGDAMGPSAGVGLSETPDPVAAKAEGISWQEVLRGSTDASMREAGKVQRRSAVEGARKTVLAKSAEELKQKCLSCPSTPVLHAPHPQRVLEGPQLRERQAIPDCVPMQGSASVACLQDGLAPKSLCGCEAGCSALPPRQALGTPARWESIQHSEKPCTTGCHPPQQDHLGRSERESSVACATAHKVQRSKAALLRQRAGVLQQELDAVCAELRTCDHRDPSWDEDLGVPLDQTPWSMDTPIDKVCCDSPCQ